MPHTQTKGTNRKTMTIKKMMWLAFIDLEKAFDKVEREKLCVLFNKEV